MAACPFCNSSVKQSVFASSENFLAIYNIAPVLPGHSLIIPKNHITSIMNLTDIEMTEMTLFARKVTELLMHVFKGDGFNWSLQDKEAAGQTVAHLHMHILPRLKNDMTQPGGWYPKIQNNFSEILDSQDRPKLDPSQMLTIISHLSNEAKKMKI